MGVFDAQGTGLHAVVDCCELVFAEGDSVQRGVRRGQELPANWAAVRFFGGRDREKRFSIGPRVDRGAVRANYACLVFSLLSLVAAAC